MYRQTRILHRAEQFGVRRFFRYVRVDRETGCWIWTGGGDRYGRFTGAVPGGRYMTRIAHRWACQVLGLWRDGEDVSVDHLCRRSRCVNPLHLEAVTYAENFRRGQVARAQPHFVAAAPNDGLPLFDN